MSIGQSRLGNALVIAGAVVGAAAVTAMALGFSPHLSEYMINLLFYKGLGAAAIGLIVVGTWIARQARRSAENTAGTDALGEERIDTDTTHQVLLDATIRSAVDELKRPDPARQPVRTERRTD